MNRAVFLDRDGTIIELVHHLTDPADVRLIDGAGEAIAALREASYKVVVVTNQSVIGRGKLTEAGLGRVNAAMDDQLAEHGAGTDGLYFCPLKPTQKDPTVIEDPMRKPGPGMLLQAASDMKIDLSHSWMVGDTVSDILAGRNAGCRTALVETGYGSSYAHDPSLADVQASDLAAAASEILRADAS